MITSTFGGSLDVLAPAAGDNGWLPVIPQESIQHDFAP